MAYTDSQRQQFQDAANAISAWNPQTTQAAVPRQANATAAVLVSPIVIGADTTLRSKLDLVNDLMQMVASYDADNVRITRCWPHDVAVKYIKYDFGKHTYYYDNKFGRPTYLKPQQVASALEGRLVGHVGGDVEIREDTDEYRDYFASLSEADRVALQ